METLEINDTTCDIKPKTNSPGYCIGLRLLVPVHDELLQERIPAKIEADQEQKTYVCQKHGEPREQVDVRNE